MGMGFGPRRRLSNCKRRGVMFLPYEFSARIEKIDYGRMYYSVVFLPAPLEMKLKAESHVPKLRVVAEIRNLAKADAVTEHAGALLPEERGKYLLLSKKVLKRLDAELGDELHIAFALDDPNRVEVPRVLADALEEEDYLRSVWEELTPGKQRGLAYRIGQAKTTATQTKRLDELRFELLG
ncbi:MAG: YdeI/OmpD-associated family protein [Pseudomonadota bacterium]